ncbi:23S rRNA Um-2552 2'-O-methyltransferase [Panacagrimonas perspica]|uniref:Ribosomal RNA large subunit methyltransferase E n=1 Tax=Panacagrimonas perspica TaxID=381431 RepID=A0A4R7PF50_9GAMM|nr:23S rRNA (uridine(2552)-2'-O)-methyltransferase RlmE [Panacagrimonas perspica]TDU32818.1 23S rRNA Um-2552 2'-O-methyltransferase [Panacagrimonas perspica]THD00932.1 23S rRNA (uridine(2552)-2'-O)-methyltransferase [Panacagrimonas perspica]
MSKKRRPSSAQWIAEHRADIYVKEAHRLGFRSRAVFKLKEISERDHLVKPGQVVVDLGAAPGGWSQWARPLLGIKGRLIALDILPMEEIPNVEIIVGDFREEAVLKELQGRIGDRAVDLVLSDMAPNVSGIDSADQVGQLYLCELALDFAKAHLKTGGHMLVKVFQGEGFEDFIKSLRAEFESVAIRKPKASRPRSREVYLLARSLRRV